MRNDGAVSAQLDLSTGVADLTLQLVNVPSVSQQEADLADAVEQALSNLGHLQVTRVGNSIVATCDVRGAGDAPRVLLGGHLDTVPTAGNLPGELKGDAVWGLGSCDMKGGVAVALTLAAAVARPNVNLTYVFYECEEIESTANGLALLHREVPQALHTDLAILLEPTNAVIEAGCQGVVRVKVVVTGERAHVARWWLGENAIHGLAPVISAVEGFGERRPVIDGVEYREGMQVVGVSGGVASNVVPDQAWVEISYRFAPDRTGEQALGFLSQLIAEVAPDAQVEVVDIEGAAPPNLNNDLVADFVRHTNRAVNAKLGWTDVARFAALGVPALNYGPGDPTVAHTRSEHVPIPQLESVYTTLYSFLTI